MKQLLLLAFVAACHAPAVCATPQIPQDTPIAATPAPAARPAPSATAASAATPPPTAPPPASAPDSHEAIVASLVGVWLGAAEATPYGGFRLALDFDRRPDGSVHSHLVGARGMYLDFLFHQADNQWVLTEEGMIPDVGLQKHTLTPAAAGEWVDGDLRVALAMTGDALVWTTELQGTPHSVFRLHKAHGPAVEQIRQAIANRAQ